MIVKIFWQPNCPYCPKAKKLGEDLKKDGINVEFYNVKEVDGLAEASFFNVLSTPSVIIVNGNKEIASWRGNTPKKEEIKNFFK
ncbi:MAG: thioredoxin family protein [Candidatus Aenigmatarchaeota archaeon]